MAVPMNPHRANLRNVLVGANRAEVLVMLDQAMAAGEKDRIVWITEFICDYYRDWEN